MPYDAHDVADAYERGYEDGRLAARVDARDVLERRATDLQRALERGEHVDLAAAALLRAVERAFLGVR